MPNLSIITAHSSKNKNPTASLLKLYLLYDFGIK